LLLFPEYVAQLPEETHRDMHSINERNATTLFVTELLRGMSNLIFTIHLHAFVQINNSELKRKN